MAESPNSDAFYTLAEAAQSDAAIHSAREQANLGDAVKAFRAVAKEGKEAPQAKVPTVSTRAHERAEQVETVRIAGISDRPKDDTKAKGEEPSVNKEIPSAAIPTTVASDSPPAAPARKTEPLAATIPPAPQSQPTSRAWAEITKREAQARAEAKSVAEEKAKIEAEKASISSARKALEEKIKNDPFGALADAGWTTETLLEKSKGGINLPAKSTAKHAETTKETQQPAIITEEKIAEIVQKQTQVKDYYANCLRELEKPEFAVLKSHPNAQNEVIRFVNLVAKQHGQVLQPTQACAILQKQYQEDLQKQVSNSAVQQALGISIAPASPATSTPAPATAPAAQSPAAKKTPKVLTNNMGSAPTLPGGMTPPKKNEQQYIAEAAATLKQLWPK